VFTEAEKLQGFLLYLEDLRQDFRRGVFDDTADEMLTSAAQILAELTTRMDTAVGGFSYVRQGAIDALPGILGHVAFGPVREVLERLEDHLLGLALGELEEGKDARERLRQLQERLGDRRSYMSALDRASDAGTVGGFPVATTIGDLGVVVRLSRQDTGSRPAQSTLRLDEVSYDIDRYEIGKPWDPSFVNGLRDGVRAATALLQSVGESTGDAGHREYAVAGVLLRPPLEGRSGGLAVAFDRLGAAVPELGPVPLVATGTLEEEHGRWFLDEMPADVVDVKLRGVMSRTPAGASQQTDYLIAPSKEPAEGVRQVPPCEHGGRPGLAAAAAAAWGDRWTKWWEGAWHRQLRRLELEPVALTDLPAPPLVDGQPLYLASRLEGNIARYFRTLTANDIEGRGSYGIIGGKQSSGRTTAAMQAAARLRAEGWHVAVLRRTGAGDLPDVEDLARAAALLMPSGCHRRLLVLDDIRRPSTDEARANDLCAFAERVTGDGLHLLLIVDGDGRQTNPAAGLIEWSTDRADFTASGLTDEEQGEMLQQLAAAAGRTMTPGFVTAVMDRRKWWLSRLQEWVTELARRGAPVELPHSVWHLPPASQAEARRACSEVASAVALGLLPPEEYLQAKRDLLVGTVCDVPEVRLSREDAWRLLEPLSDGLSREARWTKAIGDYLRWLLMNQQVGAAAGVIRQLAVDERLSDVAALIGERGEHGDAYGGQLSWEVIFDAVACSERYDEVAAMVAACLSNAPRRDRQRALVLQLAIKIRDYIPEREDPRALAFALRVLRFNRQKLYSDDGLSILGGVLRSLSSERLNRCLAAADRLAERRPLVAQLHRWEQTELKPDLLSRLDHNKLMATGSPRFRDELEAASEVIRLLRASPRARTEASRTVAVPGALLAVPPDDSWRVDARLAWWALSCLCGQPFEESDIDRIAEAIVAQAPQWHVDQLSAGLAALGQVSRRHVRRLVRRAANKGLGDVLRDRLRHNHPAQAAQLLNMMLRWAPQTALQMLYTDTENALVPRQFVLDDMAEQIADTTDGKAVGQLLRGMLRLESEFEPTRSATGDLLERIELEHLRQMLETPRLSVAKHLIAALLVARHDLVSKICDKYLDQIATNLNHKSSRIWSAQLALLLITAEEEGALKRPKGQSVVLTLLGASRKQELVGRMQEATNPAALAVHARLAIHLDRCPGPDSALAKVAAAFDRGEHADLRCSFCRMDSGQELDVLLEAAQVWQYILRLGGRTDPDTVARRALENHLQQHKAQPAIRLSRDPGRAASQLHLTAKLLPELVTGPPRPRIPLEHIAFCVSQAMPQVAADLLLAASRCDAGLAVRVKASVEELGVWEVVLDELTDPTLEERGQIMAAQLLHRLVGEPAPAGHLLEIVKTAVITSPSLPLFSSALRLLSAWQGTTEAAAAVNRRDGGWWLSRLPQDGLPWIATTASSLYALGHHSRAETLIRQAILHGIPERGLDLESLARFMSCAADALRPEEAQQLAGRIAANIRQRRAIHRGTDLDLAARLRQVGWLGYYLHEQGVTLEVASGSIISPGQTQPADATLWGLAWLDRPAWWQNRWDEALKAFGQIPDDSLPRLRADYLATSLTALLKHGSAPMSHDRLAAMAKRACQAGPRSLMVFLEAVRRRPASDATAAVLRQVIRGQAAGIRFRMNNPHLRCDPNVHAAKTALKLLLPGQVTQARTRSLMLLR
jgi:RecA/RadA recombinase